MIRQREWMQYSEAEARTGMSLDALNSLVHDGNIRKRPWYLPPFSVDLLRRVDVMEYEKHAARKA